MKPLTLLIKPAAGLCNMNCSYCFYRCASEKRSNSIMEDKTVDMLIQRIKEYQPSALNVMFQGGEPTIAGYDFFECFVKKVKQNVSCRVSFTLQTNGLLIDERFADFFRKNRFLIGISLDGNRPTNDRYRTDKNGESVFLPVMNAVKILKRNDVDFNILSVIDDENSMDIAQTYSFFKENGFNYLQFISCVDEENEVSLSAKNYEIFLKKCFDLWYEDFLKGEYVSIRHIDNYIGILLGNPPENCAMCGVCGSYFVIEANGDIYPCDFYCKSDYLLGSVFDESPFEISKKQRVFIEQSYLIHEKCRKCRYYPLCRGGCRRDRGDSLTDNVYCEAYKAFFDYAIEGMLNAANIIKNGKRN